MNERKVCILEKILSAFLVFVIVIGLIQVTVLASAAFNPGIPFDIAADKTMPQISINPKQEPVNGYYNSDIELEINVKEAKTSDLGIVSVDYWITDDEAKEHIVAEVENLYICEENLTAYERDFKGSITVDASVCNTDYVTVHVVAADLAGNTSEETYDLMINSTPPTIEIHSCDNELANSKAEKGFYAKRTVEVIFHDRASTFDKEAAVKSITVKKAEDAKGNTVEGMFDENGSLQGVAIEWSDSMKDKHIATIIFEKDAKYEWEIGTYTNKAGLSSEGYSFSEDAVREDLFVFTIDKEVPEAEIGFDENIWNSLMEVLTFGIWKNSDITVTATAADNISAEDDIKITYYKSKDGIQIEENPDLDEVKKTIAIAAQLEKLYTEGAFQAETYTVSKDEKFVVYARIADQAGNVNYISTDGLIVDMQVPKIGIATVEKSNRNNFYHSDVKVAITAEETVINNIYSGLGKITYQISASDLDEVEEGTLFDLTAEIPVTTGVVFEESEDIAVYGAAKSWKGTITVDANKFNSNHVVVEVTAADRAGNTISEKMNLSIDSTKPEIYISYHNNAAVNGTYFKADRIAEIVVTERNFNPDEVKINITNPDGVIPSNGIWKRTEGTGNKDNIEWTTAVIYSAEGDYTFDIAYTDLAGNICSGAQYGNSIAPTAFTIDKTNPTISVSYDNNSAQNGKYFKAARRATVTICEHNFDVNAVKFTQSALLNGSKISIPAVSWSHSGDIHTATISYSADGDYKFDVIMSDRAGNESGAADYGNSVAAKDFTIDKTIIQPVIGGVENEKAYKNDLIPTIYYNDVNLACYEVKLFRTRMGEKDADVTDKFIKNLYVGTQYGSGTLDTFDKISENDGIYTLSVKINDKAGNAEESTVTFTVNRFGSVYVYNDFLVSLLKDGGAYVQSITEDFVITEYNPDRLVENSLHIQITCDGKPLEKVIYDVDPEINDQVSVGSSGWYEYKYTISKVNFAAEGVYKISVSSKDAAGNTPENNNYDNMDIQFCVDHTKPEITSIVGLEKNIIHTQEVVVKYTVFDAIGLKSIKVLIDGKQVGGTITDFSDDINNYSGSFALGESNSVQKIQILAEDLSGQVTDTAADDFQEECAYKFHDEVTVSVNMFVCWFANKPLFWGTIGAVVVLIGGFLIGRKVKNSEFGT